MCLAQIAGALLVVAGVVTAAWPSQGASVFTEVGTRMLLTEAAPILLSRPLSQYRTAEDCLAFGSLVVSPLPSCRDWAFQVFRRTGFVCGYDAWSPDSPAQYGWMLCKVARSQ